MLSDLSKRAEYDARGHRGAAGFTPEDLWEGIDFGDLGFPGFDTESSLFEHLFGRRRRAGPPRGRDVEVALTIPLARVFSGGPETVTISRPERCHTCGGSGAKPGTSPRTCPDCGGTGRHVTAGHRGAIAIQQITTCRTFEGKGTVIEEPCPDCGGSGEVQLPDTVTVQIPPGIEEGTAMRIPGYGMPSPVPVGVAGNAYIVVRTAVDARFVRRGADLSTLRR